MALVPFKNLLRFLQKKCDKHLKIDKKDLSRVAKFVSLNGTKSDTYCLKSRHGQMAYSKMATLVCPVSMCLGQGLYAELFLIGALLQPAEMAKKKCLLAQTSTFETNVVCFFTEK